MLRRRAVSVKADSILIGVAFLGQRRAGKSDSEGILLVIADRPVVAECDDFRMDPQMRQRRCRQLLREEIIIVLIVPADKEQLAIGNSIVQAKNVGRVRGGCFSSALMDRN